MQVVVPTLTCKSLRQHLPRVWIRLSGVHTLCHVQSHREVCRQARGIFREAADENTRCPRRKIRDFRSAKYEVFAAQMPQRHPIVQVQVVTLELELASQSESESSSGL